MFLLNTPSVLDETMRPAPDSHVLSLEVLWTPYALRGGWATSKEPWSWLERLATLCEPGLLESVRDWRAMTPPDYEREFSMARGYAPSFPGGAVAALTARHPEEPAGTGPRCAASTSPARRPSPARACGVPAAATPRRRYSAVTPQGIQERYGCMPPGQWNMERCSRSPGSVEARIVALLADVQRQLERGDQGEAVAAQRLEAANQARKRWQPCSR